MTAPSAAAIRLPRNKFLTPTVEALTGYQSAVEEAASAASYIRNMAPIPPVAAGLTYGPVSDEWQQAEDQRDETLAKYERWRKRALVRQRTALAESSSILRSNVDRVLHQLGQHLQELLTQATPDAEALSAAGVSNANTAIERGLVAQWQQLQQDIWPDYQMLRDSQEAWHLNVAPQRYWASSRPAIDGESPATLLHIRDLPQRWPDWRNRGRTRPQINLTGPPPRPEPWPQPDGAEFLLWAIKNSVPLWIPTTKEYDEAFSQPRQVVENADLAARRAEFEALNEQEPEPYASLLIGRPPTQTTAVDLDRRRAELAELTQEGEPAR
jgi:hypothetical protein